MNVTPITTRVVTPPKDDLFDVLASSITEVPEKSVIAVTSKIISIAEGRCVRKDAVEKDALIQQEADQFLSRDEVPEGWVMHTLKNNVFIPSAGIDASNSGDYYVLWPEDSKRSAQEIYTWVQDQFGTKEFGILVTDSHTIPMRRGTMGISLAHVGFRPLNDYRGTKDLFDNVMNISLTDVADGLAASAVLVMGEGDECTPIVSITNIPFVEFGDFAYLNKDRFTTFEIPPEEDLYSPLFNGVPWKKGGGGFTFS